MGQDEDILRRRQPPRAVRIVFWFRRGKHERWVERMNFALQVGQSVSVIGTPLNASGQPSPATLSNQVYSSSDQTIFTVVPDPSTPGGAIITSVGAGSATLTETATATEPDGVTTEQIQGVATGVVTTAPPPPPPPAASIGFTFGTPFPTPPAS